MILKWNPEKNVWLKEHRGISFEVVAEFVAERKIIDIIDHPNRQKYPHQRIIVIEFKKYAYYVPFVENHEEWFLKTIIPSSKLTKKYLEDNYETG